MSCKITDSMREAFKSNPITYIVPEPKIETEPQPDGSIKLVAGWDMNDFTYAVSAIVQQMNEAFDNAIIEEFATLNGYVKERTCHRLTGFEPWPEISGYCSRCGNHLPLDAIYCSKCGSKIEEL